MFNTFIHNSHSFRFFRHYSSVFRRGHSSQPDNSGESNHCSLLLSADVDGVRNMTQPLSAFHGNTSSSASGVKVLNVQKWLLVVFAFVFLPLIFIDDFLVCLAFVCVVTLVLAALMKATVSAVIEM